MTNKINITCENDTHLIICEHDEYPRSPRKWGNYGKMILLDSKHFINESIFKNEELSNYETLYNSILNQYSTRYVYAIVNKSHSNSKKMYTLKKYKNTLNDIFGFIFFDTTKLSNPEKSLTSKQIKQQLQKELNYMNSYINDEFYKCKIISKNNNQIVETLESIPGFDKLTEILLYQGKINK